MKRRRSRHHRRERVGLIELRRNIERRETRADGPKVNVIAAWRLLTVLTLPRPQVEQILVRTEHLFGCLTEPERCNEEDVGSRATLDEILREREATSAALSVEHPLRGCRA